MTDKRKPLHHYYAPRYWLPWLGMLLLRLVCLLPHRVALGIGRLAGTLVFHIGGSRRAIVRRNIELCFPELSADARETLTRDHFKALGMMLIETGLGRWASDKHIRSLLADIKGLHHLTDALDPTLKSVRVANYHANVVHDVEVMAHSCGVAEPRQMRRKHMRVVQPDGKSIPMDRLWPRPEPRSTRRRTA